MFAQNEILTKKGSFGIVWLAAMRPKALTRRDYMRVDVQSKCKEMIEIPFAGRVTGDGRLVKRHISLFYLSHLMYGAARINNQLAIYLIYDMINMKKRMRKKSTLDLPPPTSRQLELINIEEPNYDVWVFTPDISELIPIHEAEIPEPGSPLPYTVERAAITMLEPPPLPPVEPERGPQEYVPDEDMTRTFLGQDDMADIIMRAEPRIKEAEILITPVVPPVSPVALRPRKECAARPEADVTAMTEEQQQPVEPTPRPPTQLQLPGQSELPKITRKGRFSRRQVRKKKTLPIRDVETKISTKAMRMKMSDKIWTTELEVVDFQKKTVDELFSRPGKRIFAERLLRLWSKRQTTAKEPDFDEPVGELMFEEQYEIAEKARATKRTPSIQMMKRLEIPSARGSSREPSIQIEEEMTRKLDSRELGTDIDMMGQDESSEVSAGRLPTSRRSISVPTLLGRSSLLPVQEDLEPQERVPLPEEEEGNLEMEEEQEIVSPSYTPPPPSPTPSECEAFKMEVLKQVTDLMARNDTKEFVTFRNLKPMTKKAAAKTFGALLEFHATRVLNVTQERAYGKIKIRLASNLEKFPV